MPEDHTHARACTRFCRKTRAGTVAEARAGARAGPELGQAGAERCEAGSPRWPQTLPASFAQHTSPPGRPAPGSRRRCPRLRLSRGQGRGGCRSGVRAQKGTGAEKCLHQPQNGERGTKRGGPGATRGGGSPEAHAGRPGAGRAGRLAVAGGDSRGRGARAGAAGLPSERHVRASFFPLPSLGRLRVTPAAQVHPEESRRGPPARVTALLAASAGDARALPPPAVRRASKIVPRRPANPGRGGGASNGTPRRPRGHLPRARGTGHPAGPGRATPLPAPRFREERGGVRRPWVKVWA